MPAASLVRLILLGAIWGSSFMFMKVAAPVFGPAMLIEVRLALAALFLGVIAVIARRGLNLRENAKHYLIVGAVNSAIPFLCFAYAVLYLPASVLSLFNSLAPIFGAIVAAVWLGTPLTRATIAGLACGIVGVAVLTADHILHAKIGATGLELTQGLIAATVAPICYGIAGTYIKWSSKAVEPFVNAMGSMWAAAILVLPFAVLFAPQGPIGETPIAAAVVLGVVCTGAAYLLQFRLFADVGPAKGLSVAFLIPVFGVLWGVLLLGEPVTWTLLAGGCLILLGTGLVTGFVRLPDAPRGAFNRSSTPPPNGDRL